MIVCYFAHPVGAPSPEGVRDNLARARRWLAWLIQVEPEIALCAPWLPYLDVLDAQRCDGIVACGGRISDGMRWEIDAVLDAGGWLSDLTWIGDEPRNVQPVIGNGINAGAIASGRRWAEGYR